MADDLTNTANATASLSTALDGLSTRTHDLEISATSFSRAMASAFTSSVRGGKQLDDVLKSLALRLSSLTVSSALKPLASGLTSGINSLFSGLFTSGGGSAAPAVTAATGAIKPFAAGGVLGAPAYFPLQTGGLGLAGEAGPEAIMPLTRGADGKLGVAASGGAAAAIIINIATPDAGSFRRSDAYLTGQIARAVARGQRSQ